MSLSDGFDKRSFLLVRRNNEYIPGHNPIVFLLFTRREFFFFSIFFACIS